MKYSIASNWDKSLVSGLLKINNSSKDNNNIFELFGSLSDSILGYAAPTPAITTNLIEDKIKLIKKAGFKFNYLLNSSHYPGLNIKDQNICEHIDWIKGLGPDMVTVGNEKLLLLLKNNFPELKINISIILRLQTVKKLNLLRKKYPSIARVTLYQGINRNKKKLIQIITHAHKKNLFQPVEVELLANELCLHKCRLMKDHYAYASKLSQKNRISSQKLDQFDIDCNQQRSGNILHFLNSSFIRPEDVQLYEDLGVDILKIAGKTTQTSYLLATAESYILRKLKGNIADLFSEDWWQDSVKPYIHNSNLDGFLDHVWSKNITKIESINQLAPKYRIDYLWK